MINERKTPSGMFDLQLFSGEIRIDASHLPPEQLENPVIRAILEQKGMLNEDGQVIASVTEPEADDTDTDDNADVDDDDVDDDTSTGEDDADEEDVPDNFDPEDPVILRAMQAAGLRFKSFDAFINSHKSLAAEFTRRSQRLSELEKSNLAQQNEFLEQMEEVKRLFSENPGLTNAQKKQIVEVQTDPDLSPEEKEEKNQRFIDNLFEGDTESKIGNIAKSAVMKEIDELKKELRSLKDRREVDDLTSTTLEAEDAFYASDPIAQSLRDEITAYVNALPVGVLQALTPQELLSMGYDVVKGRLSVPSDQYVQSADVRERIANDPEVRKRAARAKAEEIKQKTPPSLITGSGKQQGAAAPPRDVKNLDAASAAFKQMLGIG